MTHSPLTKNYQTKFDAFSGFISASFEENPVHSFLVAVCVFIFSVAATTWLLIGAFNVVVSQDPRIAIGRGGNKEKARAGGGGEYEKRQEKAAGREI